MSEHGPTVLIIDDEPALRRLLTAGFEHAKFLVRQAETAAEGLESAVLDLPDLIILDLGLPDQDGADVLDQIRSWSNVPVIVLSVRSNEHEKVYLFKRGADDYVVKPFGMSELLARSEAALRRYFKSATQSSVVQAGPISIDLATRRVSNGEVRIQLTRKEYKLLQVLATHAGNVVTHEHLQKEIWREASDKHAQYLRMLVRRVRLENRARAYSSRYSGHRVGGWLSLADGEAGFVNPETPSIKNCRNGALVSTPRALMRGCGARAFFCAHIRR
jgi:two-component system, OmpR family, KDP operon response regulator KdpE